MYLLARYSITSLARSSILKPLSSSSGPSACAMRLSLQINKKVQLTLTSEKKKDKHTSNPFASQKQPVIIIYYKIVIPEFSVVK